MKRIKPKIVEEICPACNGTDFVPVITQPAPGRRIYPPRCTKCDGKGRCRELTEAMPGIEGGAGRSLLKLLDCHPAANGFSAKQIPSSLGLPDNTGSL
jgi:hypothetical protein